MSEGSTSLVGEANATQVTKCLETLKKLSINDNITEVQNLINDGLPETGNFEHDEVEGLSNLQAWKEEGRLAAVACEDALPHLKTLLEQAASTDDLNHKEVGAALASFIAETAKSEEAREPLAEAGVIPPLAQLHALAVSHLKSDGTENDVDNKLKIQTLRALANLCYDNEQNRELVLETDSAIQAMVQCLHSRDKSVLRTACGALLNISMDNEPIQLALAQAQALPILLDISELGIDPNGKYADISPAAVRVLSNIVETDKAVQELLVNGGLGRILRLVSHHHGVILKADVEPESYEASIEMLDTLTTVLETIGEKDIVQRAVVSENLLDILLDFVDHIPTVEPSRNQENDDDDEEPVSFEEIRKTVSRIVTLVTMNDANMIELSQKKAIINRFKNWMTLGFGTVKEAAEDEIRMSGALCIGNLARSDDTCVILVRDHNVADGLLQLLKLEMVRLNDRMNQVKTSDPNGSFTSLREEVKGIVKVLHAVVGALKNMSLAVADRPILGSLGVIGPVAELFEVEGVKPVQYGCVGILKNLCAANNEYNTYRVIAGLEPPTGAAEPLASLPLPESPTGTTASRTPLNKLISLIWKATGDNDTGIRNEGGRAVANLIRTCSGANAPAFMKRIIDANGIPPLIQIITGALITRQRAFSTDTSLQVPDGGAAAGGVSASGSFSSFTNVATTSEPNAEGGDSDHHVHFDALPLESQVFPMVQNEVVPEAIPRVTRYHSQLIPTLMKILKSGTEDVGSGSTSSLSSSNADVSISLTDASDATTTPPATTTKSAANPPEEYPDEMKVNVCLLLESLCGGDDTFRARLDNPDFRSFLHRLRDRTSFASTLSPSPSTSTADKSPRGSTSPLLSYMTSPPTVLHHFSGD
ncbi:Rap1 GTPase-GDP dissociation stimulator 1, partial [Quaeritorhiza haematococci]